jgi:putative membrane-bound dehydrogenase-like protein
MRCVPGVWLSRLVLGCWLVFATSQVKAEDLGLKVPEGFEVSLFADDAMAHNIYSMTIDAQGRVVVSGPGYVKILHDDNGDGRAERETLFSSLPKSGAMGMCFDGPDLICSGDKSVMRLRDKNDDGVADSEPEIWATLGNGEHGAHGIVKGPDGWFYLICGNDSGVSEKNVTLPGSPVKHPKCGAVIRFSPDGKQSDVFAHGFRNPYDLDFNAAGHLFTVDSDNEREYGLPWYTPTRLFDIAQGMEHGWLMGGYQRSWNRPAAYFDNVERVVEIGRGSPTGLVVYRHRQFPERYRGGVFTACWTLGIVYHIPLTEAGSTYRGKLETFLQTTGGTGFAPVDLAVSPQGDLFVAVGGRGTRGSVFRVRYAKGLKTETKQDSDPKEPEIAAVLEADQPLSSWSRAQWMPVAKKLGVGPLEEVLRSPHASASSQIRAIELLTELFNGVEADIAWQWLVKKRPEMNARLAWSLPRSDLKWSLNLNRSDTDSLVTTLLSDLTFVSGPSRQLAAWDGLACRPKIDLTAAAGPSVLYNFSKGNPFFAQATDPFFAQATDGARESNLGFESKDRRVRAATVLTARGPGRDLYAQAFPRFNPKVSPRMTLGQLWVVGPDRPNEKGWTSTYVNACLDVYRGSIDPEERLEAVRLLQLGLGDMGAGSDVPEVYAGYTARKPDAWDKSLQEKVVAVLSPTFPTRNPDLDRELSRLFGMIPTAAADMANDLADQLTDDSSPTNDLHYLIVISRLPGPRYEKARRTMAHALAMLQTNFARINILPDRNWPLRVGEMFDELCRRDPKLQAALVDDSAFGLPAHSMFAASMTGEVQQRAAEKLLKKVRAADEDDENLWAPELVTVLACLPEESILPVLRERWDDFGLRDAIAEVLARRPQEVDRARLVESLGSPQADVIEKAAEALTQLKSPGSPTEMAAALRALKQYCTVPQQVSLRKTLTKLLTHWSGQSFDIRDAKNAKPKDGELQAAYQPWFDWFTKTHPQAATSLAGFGEVDAAAWKEKLAKIDWAVGDAHRGKQVFEKRACHRCHVGGGKLGPDLKGAAARFARDDLFAAIINPSKDVAPLYKTTLVATRTGQVYHGFIVYESASATLLQTTPDTTVRLSGDEILSVRPSMQSLMPTGLLNDVSGPEMSDLYAFLKTLK